MTEKQKKTIIICVCDFISYAILVAICFSAILIGLQKSLLIWGAVTGIVFVAMGFYKQNGKWLWNFPWDSGYFIISILWPIFVPRLYFADRIEYLLKKRFMPNKDDW